MSLPSDFETSEEYFEESISFFKEYQNLFKFSNTDILIHNVLEQIDTENYNQEQFFDKNFDLSRNLLNSFVKDFFEKLSKFSVSYEELSKYSEVDIKIEVLLSPKKKHEIVYLARELKDVCKRRNCGAVVDFGSGLGYLDQHLYDITSLKVLGLECNENFYVTAKKRQRKYHAGSVDYVKYVRHTVSENSDRNIKEYIKDKFGNEEFCITGLHACADLTINAMDLFLKIADAKALVVMPCCYHKMAEENGKFKKFPLSKCLRGYFEKFSGEEFMKVPFLRLATQPTSRNSDFLEDLVFNLLARATLQLYAHKNNMKLHRKKRKAVRMKSLHKDFSSYLQNALNGFTLTHDSKPYQQERKVESSEAEFDLDEVEKIWRETQKFEVNAAIFVLFQNYLQPIAENLVLYDRVVYLKENGINNCCFKKIFNHNFSPRCLALVSIK